MPVWRSKVSHNTPFSFWLDSALGSLGIYRAAFTSIAQTEPLLKAKIKTPVRAMGGEKGLGARVGQMVAMIADHVEASVEPTSGHFLPEEAPETLVRAIIELATAETINLKEMTHG